MKYWEDIPFIHIIFREGSPDRIPLRSSIPNTSSPLNEGDEQRNTCSASSMEEPAYTGTLEAAVTANKKE
ncbi:hypothetical protein CEXT_617451 [Caerostris extrusa]|uniref:Ycf15 n=1 Tax=Caerostris extrusa TaxID=172846 RepID=A0AAV4QTQ2_CAEEX|nr:hypothetical protein CEXT_617451 [Caerostris extrusa]